MKKSIYLLLIIIALTACEKEKSSGERVLLGFTPKALPTFSVDGDIQTISVKTNQSWWDYTLEYDTKESEEWVDISRDDNTLTITTTPNKTFASRKATLVFTIGKGENQLIRRFPILQPSKFSTAFEVEDVDENGWLWFDTQEKIDRYVGPDKIIQIEGATFGTNEPTIADPTIIGADDAGIMPNDEETPQNGTQKTGAIRLALASSALGADNGGSLVVSLKTCSMFTVFVSSNSSMQTVLKLTLNYTNIINVKMYMGGFGPVLSKAGQKEWECSKESDDMLTKINPDDVNDVSIVNMKNRYLYIHGIKLMY